MKNTYKKPLPRPAVTDTAKRARERLEKARRDERQRAETALSALYGRGKREQA